VQLEAWALLRKNKAAEAEKLLTDAMVKYPQEPTPYVTLMEFHLARKDHTNALAVLEEQLKNQPENTDALANYGAVKIQLGQLTEALPFLNQALKLDPRHRYALLSRAIVNLQTGKIDEAERDYTTLERILLRPTHPVSFGLAETARLKKNRKEALERYEEFLKLAPPGTPDIPDVIKKIKELQSGS
jgi:tetratricopeptide (TPR) repeat protein